MGLFMAAKVWNFRVRTSFQKGEMVGQDYPLFLNIRPFMHKVKWRLAQIVDACVEPSNQVGSFHIEPTVNLDGSTK
jgi:hypothetical protein